MMVPHTLLSSSDFYKFFLTKTFMVKEAVHKQAYSWLVKDQFLPDRQATGGPRCNPCKPGLAGWNQSPSPLLRVPAPEVLPSRSAPSPVPPMPLRSAHVRATSGAFRSDFGNVSTLCSLHQPPFLEFNHDSSREMPACCCPASPRQPVPQR